MPQPTHDSDDTQPRRNAPEDNHRIYIPAVWKPRGAGGGHPKISGGVTVDRRTGRPAPRAFNRPAQEYQLPQSTIQARRAAKAASEYSTAVILRGSEGRFEVRPPSGNNYDVGHTVLDCDCPDWFKLDQSGYGILRCKHIHLVMMRLADPLFPNGPDWSTARLAEYLGVSERTAEDLCNDGFFSASLQHNVWVIPSLEGFNTGKVYLAKVLFTPRDWSDTITATREVAVYDSGLQEWSQTVHFANSATFEFPRIVRAYAFDIGADNTPLGMDQFTSVFLPLRSPYWTVAAQGMAPSQVVDFTFKFHDPIGTALTYSLVVVAGQGLI